MAVATVISVIAALVSAAVAVGSEVASNADADRARGIAKDRQDRTDAQNRVYDMRQRIISQRNMATDKLRLANEKTQSEMEMRVAATKSREDVEDANKAVQQASVNTPTDNSAYEANLQRNRTIKNLMR